MSSANPTSPITIFADEVPSPCIGLCEMDPQNGWCLGCYRTMDEIKDWFKFEADKKRDILARIETRKAAVGDDD